MTIKIFNYGDEDTVHVDINKYLTFEYILEDAEKEIEAKDVELACYRIRHYEANQHMNEQDKKIKELETANKALLDQVQALKTHSATQRVECLERCNDNQEAMIRQLRADNHALKYNLEQSDKRVKEIRDGSHAKIMEHEGTIENLRRHITYLTDSITELNKREAINNIEKRNREVDEGTIARLNQLNKDLLDKLDMAKWRTKSVASTVRAAAGIVNELYMRGDLKGVEDALTRMSKPDYLTEYCRD